MPKSHSRYATVVASVLLSTVCALLLGSHELLDEPILQNHEQSIQLQSKQDAQCQTVKTVEIKVLEQIAKNIAIAYSMHFAIVWRLFIVINYNASPHKKK